MSQDISIHENDVEEHIQNCKKCNLPIYEGHAYELGDDRWHINCFECSKCNSSLGCNSNFLVLGNGNLICSNCSYNCKQCGKKIDDLAILTGDQAYCSSCFKCRACKQKIEDLRYARTSKGLFCMSCHEKLMAKKKKYDMKKKQLQMLKNERDKENLPGKFNSNPSSATNSAVSTPNLDDDERPLNNYVNVNKSKSSNISSSNDLYDLYERSRSPTPKLFSKALEESRSSSVLSKDKDLPTTPLLNTPLMNNQNLDTPILNNSFSANNGSNLNGSAMSSAKGGNYDGNFEGSNFEDGRKSLDPNHQKVIHPQPRKPMERELSIEEINDSDEELTQKLPLTPKKQQLFDDFLQPAVTLQPDQSNSPTSISHTKFQGKNLLILSPNQRDGAKSPSDEINRNSLFIDERPKSNCPSPMAKANRHARVVEDDVDKYSSEEELLEPGLATPKRQNTSNNHILSPPPKVPLPSVPSSTPKEEKLSISDQYYLDAVNGQEDLLNGLGLEGIEFNDNDNKIRRNSNHSIKRPTPSVTNLEEDYDSSVHATPDSIGRKQSIIKTPRLTLRHKRSTSGGSNNGIKLNFFKKDDKGHSRHVSDGSINNFTSLITPPIFQTQHNRSSSDTSVIPNLPNHSRTGSQTDHMDLKSMRLEVNYLDSTKKTLMADIRKLQEDRGKLNNEIDGLKQKYQEELSKLNKITKEVTELQRVNERNEQKEKLDTKEKVEEITHHQSNSSSSLVAVPEADEIETQKATKLKFWRRAKIGFNGVNGTGMSSSVSNNHLALPQSSLSQTSPNHKANMTKSRSTNLLDTFLNGGSNGTVSDDDVPLFQSSIERRCKFENTEIPLIISRCLQEVEKRGLDMEGIYRISGGNSTIQSIELAFSNINPKIKDEKSFNKLNDTLDCDINAVTSALKRYLRKIPDPLIPYDLYVDFINLNSINDETKKVNDFKSLLTTKLPNSNKSVLLELCRHLELVNSFSNVNRMNYKNLSVVFAPTIARDESGQREMMDMGSRNDVTEFLFVNYDRIFH
ncbi:rho-type GTPase-activating protein 1 [[Candida] jaroonii]|uniref:Rho-type GTPase-activating protein 1 n=1 Tax=[Candida] jaroonii TaxID=467808 RepID=A0ACA9Y6J4_9ASCO|nr:rho-type GTPase-activating protein 1 [[Candida] jaroonii]